MAVAAPIAFREEGGDLIKRIGGKGRLRDGKSIAANKVFIPGANIQIIAPACGGRPIQQGIAPRTAIIILTYEGAIGITKIDIGILKRFKFVSSQAIQRNSVERACHQIHTVPIMIRIHLQHANKRRTDGDCKTCAGVTRYIHRRHRGRRLRPCGSHRLPRILAGCTLAAKGAGFPG